MRARFTRISAALPCGPRAQVFLREVEVSASPVEIYLRLFAYVATLSARALARRGHYFAIALGTGVVLAGVQTVISLAITRAVMANPATQDGWGFAGGMVSSLFQAAAISLVLYVGRAMIEQRNLGLADLQTGIWAFFGDVINVFFALWVASYVISIFHIDALQLMLFLALVVMPIFETVALSPATGFGIFESAYRFFIRDWMPWVAGQVPLLGVIVLYLVLASGLGVFAGFGSFAITALSDALLAAFLLLSFVYRGILYLTLDGNSPRRRAERFGGAPSVR